MNPREVLTHAYDIRDVRHDYCLRHGAHHKQHAQVLNIEDLEITDAVEYNPVNDLYARYMAMGNPVWDSDEGKRQTDLFALMVKRAN